MRPGVCLSCDINVANQLRRRHGIDIGIQDRAIADRTGRHLRQQIRAACKRQIASRDVRRIDCRTAQTAHGMNRTRYGHIAADYHVAFGVVAAITGYLGLLVVDDVLAAQ